MSEDAADLSRAGSPGLYLFTWNVDRELEALLLACRHLASRKGDWIAAFQEVPPDFQREPSFVSVSKGVKVLVPPAPDPGRKTAMHRMTILGSSKIRASNRALFRRIAGITVRTERWQRLQVLAVHLVDPRSAPHPFARGVEIQAVRQDLETFWESGGPLVVLGDFNADPFSPEMTARTGMLAVRRHEEMVRTTWRGRAVLPLYNPMWAQLPQTGGGPAGTFHYDSDYYFGSWHWYDQILVSQPLVEHCSEIQILSELDGRSLLRAGRPSGPSDHLPVALTLNLHQVPQCQILPSESGVSSRTSRKTPGAKRTIS